MSLTPGRHPKLLVSLSLLFVLSLTVFSFVITSRSSAQARKYTVKTFKDMPVEIKEVRNLQNAENWFRDLEIEVKNISDKPIYFISMSLRFPDIPVAQPSLDSVYARAVAGFTLLYGRHYLGDIKNLASPEAVALRPGETYVFTIPEGRVSGLENMIRTMNLPPDVVKNIILHFDTISFGDGTGYAAGGALGLRDYRGRTSWINQPAQLPRYLPPERLEEQLFRKVSFKNSSLTPLTAAQDGCGSGNCSRWYIVQDGLWCSDGIVNCGYTELANSGLVNPA